MKWDWDDYWMLAQLLFCTDGLSASLVVLVVLIKGVR